MVNLCFTVELYGRLYESLMEATYENIGFWFL